MTDTDILAGLVKPLVWGYHPAGKIASNGMGAAYIIDTRQARVRFLKWPSPFAPDVATLEAAQAAANADQVAKAAQIIDVDKLRAVVEALMRISKTYAADNSRLIHSNAQILEIANTALAALQAPPK